MLNITARGFKLRDGIKEKVKHELVRVEKMLPDNAEYNVTITLKHNEFKCDITVKNIGTFVRGEAKSEEVLPAVDFAVDDLKRKLRKLKTKLNGKHGYSKYEAILCNYSENTDDDAEEFKLDRVKPMVLKTMTDEEASLQMELLGHDFFVYKDSDGYTSILYGRKERNGSYGKIICK